MAGGRPTKFNKAAGERICENLRSGCSRKAAAESVGVDYRTLLNWVEAGEKAKSGEFFQFFQALTRVEAEVELRNTSVMAKAAAGWDAGSVKVTTRSVVKIKRTVHPDGTIVDEPVVLQLTSREETTTKEFDWRAALEFLKRRRREDWGDHVNVDLDREIAQLLAQLAGGGEAQTPG